MLDSGLQGKVALQGFCAGEPQNRDVTDVISKVPTKRSKSWSPQDAHFFGSLLFPKSNCTQYLGGHLFFPSFLPSIGYFKAILHISGSKKWSKQMATDGTPHERTDAHQKFEASYTKALKGNNVRIKAYCIACFIWIFQRQSANRNLARVPPSDLMWR